MTHLRQMIQAGEGGLWRRAVTLGKGIDLTLVRWILLKK